MTRVFSARASADRPDLATFGSGEACEGLERLTLRMSLTKDGGSARRRSSPDRRARLRFVAGDAVGAAFAVYLLRPNLQWAWAFSKLARSFGVIPADRGLITSGPYALVRHPLYSAYLVGGIGYLIRLLSAWNVVVDVISFGWQLVRISAEERLLEDDAYAAYRARVSWRLCPGLW